MTARATEVAHSYLIITHYALSNDFRKPENSESQFSLCAALTALTGIHLRLNE